MLGLRGLMLYLCLIRSPDRVSDKSVSYVDCSCPIPITAFVYRDSPASQTGVYYTEIT